MSQRYLELFVSGKVQGVYFRAHTQQLAAELGLSGFVANLPDGRVYIQVTGPEAALQTFLNWCEKGPSQAHVEAVDLREIPAFKQEGFVIKRSGVF